MTRIVDEVVKLNIPARGPKGLTGEQGPQGQQGVAGPLGAPGLIPIPSQNATGTVDVIVTNYDPDLVLTDKLVVAFRSSGQNISATPTFNPDGLGAKTITKHGGQVLNTGDISNAGAVHLLGYDLTNDRWDLLNPATSDVTLLDGGNIGNIGNLVPSGNQFIVALNFPGGSALIPFTSVYTFTQAVKFPYNSVGFLNLTSLNITALSYDAINNQYFNILTNDDDLNHSVIGWTFGGDDILDVSAIAEVNLPLNVSLVDGGTMLQFELGAELFFRHLSAYGPQSTDLADISFNWVGETI